MDLEKELNAAIGLACAAGDEIMHIYETGFEAQIKEDGTEVTIADRRANEIILEGIVEAFPDDGIISEELARIETKSERFWYIDPIDGTSGFIKRRGDFAVHIGLAAVGERPMLGVVYQPSTRDLYHAVKGSGAYHIDSDGGRTRLAVDASGRDPVVVLGREYSMVGDYVHALSLLGISKAQATGSQGLRMMHVARGEANLHFLINHRAGTWDTCAPQAIVEEAGGIVRFLDGWLMMYHGHRSWNGRAFVVAAGERMLDWTVSRLSQVDWKDKHAHDKVE